jgi:hypothetical protein
VLSAGAARALRVLQRAEKHTGSPSPRSYQLRDEVPSLSMAGTPSRGAFSMSARSMAFELAMNDEFCGRDGRRSRDSMFRCRELRICDSDDRWVVFRRVASAGKKIGFGMRETAPWLLAAWHVSKLRAK